MTYPRFMGNPGPLTANDRLVFLHLEKTAGSTIRTLLAERYPEGAICPERYGAMRYWPPERLRDYRFFGFHGTARDLAYVPRPFKTVTFLRDPVDRLISLYRFWTSFRHEVIERDNNILPRFAKPLSFRDFLSEKSLAIVPSLRNIYAQTFAGDPFIAPSGRLWRSSRELLETALDNMERMNFVGIVEHMDISIRGLNAALGFDIVYSGQRENDTDGNRVLNPGMFEAPNAIAFDDATREALHEVTRLDRVLYDRARVRLGISPDAERSYHCIPMPDAILFQDDGRSWVRMPASSRHVCFGPYISLPAGSYRASFTIRSGTPCPATRRIATIDVAINQGSRIVADTTVYGASARRGDIVATLDFRLDRPAGDAEFRIMPWLTGDAAFALDVKVRRL